MEKNITGGSRVGKSTPHIPNNPYDVAARLVELSDRIYLKAADGSYRKVPKKAEKSARELMEQCRQP